MTQLTLDLGEARATTEASPKPDETRPSGWVSVEPPRPETWTPQQRAHLHALACPDCTRTVAAWSRWQPRHLFSGPWHRTAARGVDVNDGRPWDRAHAAGLDAARVTARQQHLTVRLCLTHHRTEPRSDDPMNTTPLPDTAETAIAQALRETSTQLGAVIDVEHVPAIATAITAALDQHLVSGHNPDIDLDDLADACERFLEVHRDVEATRTVFGPATTRLKRILTGTRTRA